MDRRSGRGTWVLDETDLRILDILRLNARATNKTIADRVGLSASACHDRVRRLERTGVIGGYRAVVRIPGEPGRVEAWIEIELSNKEQKARDQVEEFISGAPDIVAAYRLAGPFDFLVHLSTVDIASLTQLELKLRHGLGHVIVSRLAVVVQTIQLRPRSS